MNDSFLMKKEDIYQEMYDYFLEHNQSYISSILDKYSFTDISIPGWIELIRLHTYTIVTQTIQQDTYRSYKKLALTKSLLPNKDCSYDILQLLCESI